MHRNILIGINLFTVALCLWAFINSAQNQQTGLEVLYGILFVYNGILLKWNVERS